MSNAFEMTGGPQTFAIEATESDRVAFIRRTYAHLMTAVLIFCGLEGMLLSIEPVRNVIAVSMLQAWWAVLLVYLVVSWLARWWAESSTSVVLQYVGLALYTVFEALIFVPIMVIALNYDSSIIPMAAILTLLIFGALTASVFLTGADFSFLRTGLMIAGFAAFGLCLCGAIFGFELGLFFTVGVIGLMCGYILYDTSNVLHHYRTDQHVAASLALFASLTTLFWYVIRLMIILQGDD
ncbi:Bax inhibitor-1/YccA family protein [Calycomorphotria hydatis]|uniref:Inhibitor of apoptosis-promoting Bax1 n=1 Tax=Calycomorphotria hydatis TaxID=2528027 RepID=A0A517T4T7_9PLAN|nr:Bax inhibitor-1 family protein [Calycomorphotria hydatis]QDT63379.1 Inhibitor of apoptosis-promoting Bax1 [Calycomorphotria hydatis]